MTATNNKADFLSVRCEIYWAHLTQPDQMSGKYSVRLCNLSEAAVKALAERGVTATQNLKHPEYGFHITPKSQFEIKAEFEDGTPCTELIGNGSVAIARLKIREWKYQRASGFKADVVKLVITDFVPYHSASEAGNHQEDEVF